MRFVRLTFALLGLAALASLRYLASSPQMLSECGCGHRDFLLTNFTSPAPAQLKEAGSAAAAATPKQSRPAETLAPGLDVVGAPKASVKHHDIHPHARGLPECTRSIADKVRASNLPSAVKDTLDVLTHFLTEEAKDSHLRMLTSLPLHLTNAEAVKRAIKVNNVCSPTNGSLPNTTSVAICAVHSSVGPLLQQWLMHYLGLGVSKIFLMNHNVPSPAYTNSSLQPFIDAGYVEMFSYTLPGQDFPQVEIYQHCQGLAKRAGYQWLGIIDVDEYWIASKEYNSSATPNETRVADNEVICLNGFLQKYADEGAVVFPWRVLSSVGTPLHDYSTTILEQYPKEYREERVLVKTFYNLRFLGTIGAVHHTNDFSDGKYSVNIEGRMEPSLHIQNMTSTRYLEYAEIRHYWGMSLLENILFKICGTSWERKMLRANRVKILIEMLKQADVAKEASHVPPGYVLLLKRLLGIS
jgi:hypothetical protein